MSNIDSTIEPVAKRQKTNEKKPLMKDLSPKDFINMLNLFEGPKVTIIVEKKEFKLPKALLCYHSDFFDKAFNGPFKESVEQRLPLTGCTIDTFELVIQWLYTSSIVVSPNIEGDEANVEGQVPVIMTVKEALVKEELRTTAYSGYITRLLNLLKFKDEINLIGPFDIIIQHIKNTLLISRRSLTPIHVRSAAELPKNHPIRTLFAQSCFPEYVTNGLLEKQNRSKFRFAKELHEIDEFAADLMKETIIAFPKRTRKIVGNKGIDVHRFYLPDPLTGTTFKVEL